MSKSMKEISFIENAPALIVKRERLLAVGDLHVGRELKLARGGIFVPNATKRLSGELLRLQKKHNADGIALLGDVKDSVGYPTKEEYQALSEFFYDLRNVKVTITKGNHDPRIEEIVRRLDADVEVVKELLLEKVALMHGHALPSGESMGKSFIVAAHSHPAVSINGKLEKAWAVMKIGRGARKIYPKFNRSMRLVMMPAFNELITGSDLASGSKFSPLLKNDIFDFRGAKVYDIRGKEIRDALSDIRV